MATAGEEEITIDAEDILVIPNILNLACSAVFFPTVSEITEARTPKKAYMDVLAAVSETVGKNTARALKNVTNLFSS